MGDARSDYWRECIAESLDEHGVQATDDQISAITNDMRAISEGMELAFPSGPPPEPPSETEIGQLRKQLAAERSKITCRECDGTGTIVEVFGPTAREAWSQCSKCRGEGRHAP